MARRPSASARDSFQSRPENGSGHRKDPYANQTFHLDEEPEQPKGVWCIVATVVNDEEDPSRGGDLQQGADVYCFPPMRGGAFESVEVIGQHRKTEKWIESFIPATDLTAWRAVMLSDPAVLELISPPWDSSHVS